MASAILLEIAFRLMPVADLFERGVVNETQPIIRYHPNQDIRYSIGWNFYQKSKKTTNNFGFVHSNDYVPMAEPDFAVIGDSFVEAMQVDNEEAFQEVVGALRPGLKIYSFGISGSALSQYVEFARYAENTFNPKSYVFVIIGNDFDQSLCEYRPKPGNYCFDENYSNTLVEFDGFPLVRAIARNSAFARYVALNLNINWQNVYRYFLPEHSELYDLRTWRGYTQGTANEAPQRILERSKSAVRVFVEEVNDIIDGKPVVFILDADRQGIYNGTFEPKSYFEAMKAEVKRQSKTLPNSIVIDMTDEFKRKFEGSGMMFDFSTDGHWNEEGHKLVAETFLKMFFD